MGAVWVLVRNSRLAQVALAALVVVLLIVGAVALWREHNATVAETAVTLDRADISAEVSNRVMAADQAATVNAIARDEAAADNDKELTHEASRSDGNAVVSVLERMRQQQAAGRR